MLCIRSLARASSKLPVRVTCTAPRQRYLSRARALSATNMSGPTTSAADQAHVAELKQHMSETSASAKVTGSISDIPDVSIDSGIYKYVLIKVFDPVRKEEKYIVRGKLQKAYHADVADPVVRELKGKGFQLDVTGGGRIKKDDGSKDIVVYGHSYGFGRANHSISADLIRKAYPDFKVEWSNDGY